MNTGMNEEGPSDVVKKAIREAFPKDAEEIIAELRWHFGDGFWSFHRWGMFVGVELDGYIHT